MGTYFVYKYGSEELRQRYLVPALRGEKVATFALTEPNAGSDVGNITTIAERVEGGWRLKGAKTWVTNAPVADMLTVCAKTSQERGMKHIALFLVDRQFPGVTLGQEDRQARRPRPRRPGRSSSTTCSSPTSTSSAARPAASRRWEASCRRSA